MKNIKSKLLLLFALSLSLATCYLPLVYADNISISASVDKSAATLDDQITLELAISGGTSNLPNPVMPDMSNFNIYSSGRSQSMSIVNGQMTSSVILRYTLVPKNVGKYTIRPISMVYEGKTYQTEPIQVDVLPAGKSPRQAAAPAAGGATVTDTQKNLFVTADVDKKTAYVNEQIVYTFKFYRRIRLLANPQYSPADFRGFWTEDTAPKNYYSTVNGAQYLVTEVRTLLFPTKSGNFNLGSASLQCSVEDFSQNDPFNDSFFQSFFSGGKTQVVNTNPVSVNVLPLPEQGKPQGFNGAVGQFRISGSIDKKSVKANEPVTLSVVISGTGNMKTVPDPVLPDWQDFKKYETASSLNINKDGDTLKGSKEFKTIIVPLAAGQKTIKPIQFAYFDPAAKAYRTAQTDSMPLDVKPGDPGSTPAVGGLPASKGEVTVLASDVRYIKTPGTWKRYQGPLYLKPWFIALNAFPVTFFGLFFGYVKWREKLTGDVAFARRLRASSTARKFLKKASALLGKNAPPADYYCAVSRALLEYIANKNNVSADGLTPASIDEILTKRSVTRETINAALKMIEECNLVRFAPTIVNQEMMRSIFYRIEDVIGKLEKEMR